MATPTINQDVLRNSTMTLSAGEREVLEGAISQTRILPAGHITVRQGETVNISMLRVRGLMTRYVDTIDGRRHLVAVRSRRLCRPARLCAEDAGP